MIMYGDFVVHTRKLREQADEYLAERQTADQLLEEIRRAGHLSPENSREYQELEREARELSSYYAKMSSATKSICESVERTSGKIHDELEENVYGK